MLVAKVGTWGEIGARSQLGDLFKNKPCQGSVASADAFLLLTLPAVHQS